MMIRVLRDACGAVAWRGGQQARAPSLPVLAFACTLRAERRTTSEQEPYPGHDPIAVADAGTALERARH